MATLIGKETNYGSNLYKDNLLLNIKRFCFIGSDTVDDSTVISLINQDDLVYSNITDYNVYEADISYAGYDNEGQAQFDCLLPYSTNLNKYIYAIALINIDNDGNKELTDWAIIEPFFQKSQVGGIFTYKTSVSGNSGDIIFKDTDLVTENQVIDLIHKESGSSEELDNVIAKANDNASRLNAVENDIDTINSNVSTHDTKIAKNTRDIASNLDKIDALTSQSNTNKNNINRNLDKIDINTQNISNNLDKINALTNKVDNARHVPDGGTENTFLAGDGTWKTAISTLLKKPVLTANLNTVTSTYETNNYNGMQTASNWYIYNTDGTIVKQELNSTILTEYSVTGLNPDTDYIIKKQNISGNFTSPKSDSITVHTLDKEIEEPTDIAIEGAPSNVPNNPELTINSLPNAVACSVDKVECRVMQGGNLVGSVIEITDLSTLPVVVEMPDLEVSTTYSFECRGVDSQGGIIGAWGSVEGTTVNNFIPIVDPFKDGSGVALYLFDGNINDEGGVYNGTFYGDSYSTACGNKSILKDQAYDRVSAAFLYDGAQMPGFSDSDTFTVSFFAKIKNPPNNGAMYTILTTTTGYNQANNGNRKRYITFGDSREIIYAETPDDAATVTKSVSFGVNADDTCHHFAVTKSGSTVKTYVDGVLKNTSSELYTDHYANLNTVRLLTPAGSSHNNDLVANGHVSIIHFFNRVLTESEINKLKEETYS